jgi:hypothetical protein
MQTSFSDFVKCARTWTARRIFLRAVLMSRSVRDAERSNHRPECIQHLKQVQCHAHTHHRADARTSGARGDTYDDARMRRGQTRRKTACCSDNGRGSIS